MQNALGLNLEEAPSDPPKPARAASYFGLKSVEEGVGSDQSSRLKDALESGLVVDGDRRTFTVEGNIRPEAFTGLRNIGLRQLAPPAPGRRTLDLRNASDFTLENILADGGSVYSGPRDYISNNAQIFVSHCQRFRAIGCLAEKGGAGSGIAFEACSDFDVSGLMARDLLYDLPAATDDIVQGIWFANCSRFTAKNLMASNLTGIIDGQPSRRFTRGIAVSGSSAFVIEQPQVQHVDQGIDITGSAGNRDFLVVNARVKDVGTWGIKCANTATRGKIVGCKVENSGLSGFVASPVFGASNVDLDIVTSDLTFIGCSARNPGGSPASGSDSYAGFNIISDKLRPTVPHGIIFINCTATDDRGSGAAMTYGFVNATPNAGLPREQHNRLVHCSSVGHTVASSAGFDSGP